MNDDSDEPKDSGSVWTSYSDMFTTMAIIFLVMFIFALLQSGVKMASSVKRVEEQKKMLVGQTPKKVVKKNELVKKKLKKSINEIEKVSETITSKLEDLKSLSEKLHNQKNNIHHILKDQGVKEAQLAILKQKNKEHEHTIATKELEIEDIKQVHEQLEIEKNAKAKRLEEIYKQTIAAKELATKNANREHLKTITANSIALNKLKKLNQEKIKELEELKNLELKKVTDALAAKVEEVEQKIKTLNKISQIKNALTIKTKALEEKLKRTNEDHRNKVVEHQNKLKSQQEEFAKKVARRDEDFLKVKTQIKDVENAKRQKQTVIEKLQKTISDHVAKNKDIERKSESLLNVIAKQTEEIKRFKDSSDGLKERLSKSQMDHAKLTGKIGRFKNDIRNAKNEKTALMEKVQGLETKVGSLSNEKDNLNAKVKNLSGRMKGLKDRLKGYKSTIASMSDKKNDLANKINGLNSELSYLNRNNKDLKDAMATLKDKIEGKEGFIAGLQKEQMDLRGKIKSKNKLASILGDLKGKNKTLVKRNNVIVKKFNACKKDSKKLKSKNKKIEKYLGDVTRGIASVKANLRSQIGSRIAKALEKANLKAKVDPVTGNVILQMDDAFLFDRDSAKLTKFAKVGLKELIPLYANELLKDQGIRDQITNINIIGHASPRHQGKYVDPFDKNHQDAYNYNLDLSMRRANSIVKYIFAENFGHFPHRTELRKKVSAIGKSFSRPIDRTPASEVFKESDTFYCGNFDCKLSRRVEISFTLKDNPDVLKQLDVLQKE
ncbi:MAG: OmpA family protein [Bacteriovoracaceae bacterium]|nr:OmpA family protein [Bacteriovoracaceae bacterium]